MSIWKITSKGPIKVKETKLKQEKIREESLEDWIVSDPNLLGERLLIIGRQVLIPDVRDKLDILALDSQGNSVVIELKRGKLKDPVDMQALRYASYISKWRFEDFENQARNYLGKPEEPEFNFNDRFETFCEEMGVDKVPDLNSEQRIIVVGAEVKEKLGSVALWLRQHSVDIKVIEVEVYHEGETIFIQPQVIIPLPVRGFEGAGRIQRGVLSHPWVTDGESWHLEKRCSPKTREIFLQLSSIIRSLPDIEVDGPRWNQKFYIAYKVGNYNWLTIYTRSTILSLDFMVKAGAFKSEDLAKRLGITEYDSAGSFSEKLGLGNSVSVWNRNQNIDTVTIRLKEEFWDPNPDIEVEAKNTVSPLPVHEPDLPNPWHEFLWDAYEAFPYHKMGELHE